MEIETEKEKKDLFWVYVLGLLLALILMLVLGGFANGQEIIEGTSTIIENASGTPIIERTIEEQIIRGDIVGEDIITQEINPLKVKIKNLDEKASQYAKELDYYRFTYGSHNFNDK